MLLVPTAHMESPVTQVDRDTLRHALEDSAFCQPKAANSDAVQHIWQVSGSTLLIVWRRCTLYDVELTAVRSGSTLTSGMHVATVAAVNVATERLAP